MRHPYPTIVLTGLLFGCASFLNPKPDYDEIDARRLHDQSYFEDSLSVFFFEYRNPYPDKEVLWFASYMEGEVAMKIHNMENDSLIATYRFAEQESPLYPIAYREEKSEPVKLVILVNDRPKCARLVPWLYPLAVPQWGTSYEVDTPK